MFRSLGFLKEILARNSDSHLGGAGIGSGFCSPEVTYFLVYFAKNFCVFSAFAPFSDV